MCRCCRQNAGPQAGYRDLLFRLQVQQGGPVRLVPDIMTDSPPRDRRTQQRSLSRRFHPVSRRELEL